MLIAILVFVIFIFMSLCSIHQRLTEIRDAMPFVPKVK